MGQTGKKFDIVIIGGGTGGCAAAMAATEMGYRVLLTEETDWIGGQLTSQAVPPDEHPWIESFGCTRSYRQFRDEVREFYRDYYPLTQEARRNPRLNPGGGWVSHICMEPRVALAVLEANLAFARASGRLEIWLNTVPIAADVDGDSIRAVTLQDRVAGDIRIVEGAYFLDATELGDLLPLTGTEYRVGAEGRDEFNEPSAPEVADPENVQGFTWCFAMGYDPGGQHVIEKPSQYEYWKGFVPQVDPPWPGPLLSWTISDPQRLSERTFSLFGQLGMFSYRQIVNGTIFDSEVPVNDVTIVNWAQNDCLERVIDMPRDRAARALENARQLSFSLMYWLQTEAPRDEGGTGYPELYLCPEVMGTRDGLAKAPYHRESRRIQAEFTITENHVGVAARPGATGSEKFADSVGVGGYRIDLHPSSRGRNSIDLSSHPFQIPLRGLVPVRIQNLLPACKNIGTTHITNGCYRLHPVEWNIGEAAGNLAGFCLRRKITPHQVANKPELVTEFQLDLLRAGFELDWPQMRAL